MDIIYALSDPRTDELRYVGITAEPLEVRLRKHCWSSTITREPCHRTYWIKSLLEAGVKPVITEIERTKDGESGDHIEIFYIAYFRSLGFRLVNYTDGGDGWTKGVKKRFPMTEEAKQHLSRVNKGRKKTSRSAETNMKFRHPKMTPIVDQNGNEYFSIAEAARCLHLDANSISRVVTGVRRTTGGYSFKPLKQEIK